MSAPAPGPLPASVAGVARPTHRGGEPRAISWAEQARIIFMKDLMIELRTGEVVSTSAFFGFVCVIMASISFHASPKTDPQVAAGAIWLSTAVSRPGPPQPSRSCPPATTSGSLRSCVRTTGARRP